MLSTLLAFPNWGGDSIPSPDSASTLREGLKNLRQRRKRFEALGLALPPDEYEDPETPPPHVLRQAFVQRCIEMHPYNRRWWQRSTDRRFQDLTRAYHNLQVKDHLGLSVSTGLAPHVLDRGNSTDLANSVIDSSSWEEVVVFESLMRPTGDDGSNFELLFSAQRARWSSNSALFNVIYGPTPPPDDWPDFMKAGVKGPAKRQPQSDDGWVQKEAIPSMFCR
mmetsp:Transcript_5454/g.12417  ORF Transcript_5454/g.12417 Transcript_5454/m.12417 type:complete len:222 (+) Transcript_5454:117-782(+)